MGQSFFVRFQHNIHHFEGLLIDDVKIKQLIFENLLIVTHFASTGHMFMFSYNTDIFYSLFHFVQKIVKI